MPAITHSTLIDPESVFATFFQPMLFRNGIFFGERDLAAATEVSIVIEGV